jgi:hypothetical protein
MLTQSMVAGGIVEDDVAVRVGLASAVESEVARLLPLIRTTANPTPPKRMIPMIVIRDFEFMDYPLHPRAECGREDQLRVLTDCFTTLSVQTYQSDIVVSMPPFLRFKLVTADSI